MLAALQLMSPLGSCRDDHRLAAWREDKQQSGKIHAGAPRTPQSAIIESSAVIAPPLKALEEAVPTQHPVTIMLVESLLLPTTSGEDMTADSESSVQR